MMNNTRKESLNIKILFLTLVFLSASILSVHPIYASSPAQNSIRLEVAEEEINSTPAMRFDDSGVTAVQATHAVQSPGSLFNMEIQPEVKLEKMASDKLVVTVEGDAVSVGNTDSKPHIPLEETANTTSPAALSSMAVAAALPDYAITAVTSNSTGAFTSLGASSFLVTAKNLGGTAASTANIRCAIHLDGQLVNNFSLIPMPGGSTATFTLEFSGVGEGTHTVTITINDNFAIAESNTANNALSPKFVWVGTPDLVVTNFTSITTTPTVGSPVTFEVQISNAGNGKASKAFNVGINLDNDPIGNLPISSLDYGYIATYTFSLTFFEKMSYPFLATADSTKVVAESIETNNTRPYTLSNLRIAPNITVSGSFKYGVYNHAGSSSPNKYESLSNYPIMIVDDATLEVKANLTTNANGAFSKTITNNTANDGCDVVILIPMENNTYVRIRPQSSSNAYVFTSPVIQKYQEPSLSLGTIYLDGSEEAKGAFNIYHWIKKGKDVYESNAGSLGVVTVAWDPSGTEGSHQLESTLFLTGNMDQTQYDSDIILHEYGHFVMWSKGRMPSIYGGLHYWGQPSTGYGPNRQDGTAYSEGYAHFFSAQVKETPTIYNYDANGNYYGGNLINLEYHYEDGTTEVVSRQTPFYYNGRMEFFTAGAMNKLAANYNSFNKVNDIVMSTTRESSIDFYEAFMLSSTNKVADWQAFNTYHSAFDYYKPLPTAITAANNQFIAIGSDEVGVEKVYWYIDGTYQGSGYTLPIPAGLSSGVTHEVRADMFDYEGYARGNMSRENINNFVLRTEGFDSATLWYDAPSSRLAKAKSATAYALDNIPGQLAKHEFVSDDMFIMSNIGDGVTTQILDGIHSEKVTVRNDTISIDADTDLYFTGNVFAYVEGIELINSKGEVSATVKGLKSDSYVTVSGLPAGDYTIKLKKSDKATYREEIPYRIIAFAVPVIPELELPENLAEDSITINNPYANTVVMELGGETHTILPESSTTIALAQGYNDFTYYAENEGRKSEAETSAIFVDTISPVVTINSVTLVNDVLRLNGTVSEYVYDFTINGEDIMLGEFNVPGEPISFGYYFEDTNINAFAISAVDGLGNSFQNNVTLVK